MKWELRNSWQEVFTEVFQQSPSPLEIPRGSPGIWRGRRCRSQGCPRCSRLGTTRAWGESLIMKTTWNWVLLQDCIHGEGTTQVQAGLAGHSHSIYNPGTVFSANIFKKDVLRGDVVYKPESYPNPRASFYQSFCIRNYLTLIGLKKILRTTLLSIRLQIWILQVLTSLLLQIDNNRVKHYRIVTEKNR